MIIKNELLSTPEVVAHAAQLSMANLVSYTQDSSFPVVEYIKSLMQADVLGSDSAASAITAALAASSVEKRAFVPIAYPDPAAVREAASVRMPVVIFAAANPESVMPLRDAGCIIVFCESHQELLDTIIRSFKVCGDNKVLLPCVVVWDGPLDYSEPLSLPSDQIIKNFLPPLKMPHKLDMKNPSHLGHYGVHARQQQQKAMESVFKIAAAVDENWNKKFKRSWPAVEKHQADDAELLLVTYGYHSSTAKAAVNALRAQGKKVGLVRIRIYRPFPLHALSLLKEKKVAVLDFAASPGAPSPLYQEIKSLAKFSLSFISLDKYLSEKNFAEIFAKLEKAEKEEVYWL
ncbi:MAG: hypothetical protein HY514_04040 [Candidatus Aenigmarchaeota archaeon]|nr:hypothetical protein [Candidatus Aenigmarchaeota archaeon]